MLKNNGKIALARLIKNQKAPAWPMRLAGGPMVPGAGPDRQIAARLDPPGGASARSLYAPLSDPIHIFGMRGDQE